MILFRNDDVSANTNYLEMQEIYHTIKEYFPSSEILTCASIYCKRSPNFYKEGALYPDLPLKNRTNKYIYNANAHVINDGRLTQTLVSHGLFHVKHGLLSEDAQEMSIVGSCRYLGTNKFVAPFNSYNYITEKVCLDNNIELTTKKYDWKSLEHNDFDSSHKYWYFHSWRFNKQSFKEKLDGDISKRDSKQLGQLQTNSY